MSYKTDLVARLKDPDDGWPHFETADFMETLDAFAEEAFTKKSVEGHLAAMLMATNLRRNGEAPPTRRTILYPTLRLSSRNRVQRKHEANVWLRHLARRFLSNTRRSF
jgi:hypothetical protein